jgi:N-acetylmuramoyl-L-alanine amidase
VTNTSPAPKTREKHAVDGDRRTVTVRRWSIATIAAVCAFALAAPGVSAAHTTTGPQRANVKDVQERLIELGYLVDGDDDGRFGPATHDAIVAFQKWERLGRTGLLDRPTKARLTTATHPSPLSKGGNGKRAEILLDRQVALLIADNRVVRTIAVSSGKPSTPTPPGNYRVYAKVPRWWSTPFREWLPWALPFAGGIAFHEFQSVPTFAASHGCVRQSFTVARWTYNFATVGMPVKVIAKS